MSTSSASATNDTSSETTFSERQLKCLVAFIVLLQYLARKRENFIVPLKLQANYLQGAAMIAKNFARNPREHFYSENFYHGFFISDINCGEPFLDSLVRVKQTARIGAILNNIVMAEPIGVQTMDQKSVITEELFGHGVSQLRHAFKLTLQSLDQVK